MNIYSFLIYAFLMKRTLYGRSAFSGTGRSGAGPEPAVCTGARPYFAHILEWNGRVHRHHGCSSFGPFVLIWQAAPQGAPLSLPS